MDEFLVNAVKEKTINDLLRWMFVEDKIGNTYLVPEELLPDFSEFSKSGTSRGGFSYMDFLLKAPITSYRFCLPEVKK